MKVKYLDQMLIQSFWTEKKRQQPTPIVPKEEEQRIQQQKGKQRR